MPGSGEEIQKVKARHGQTLIKNSVLTLFNSVFMLATTWIISIWVARQLGPANYGIFSLVLWFTGTASWALGMGLIHAVTKFIAESKGGGDNDPTPVVLFVLKVEVGLAIVSTVVLLAFRTAIADFFFSPSESFFFLIAFLGLLPGVLTAVFSATIEGIQKFEYFTYANLIVTPVSFAAKIVVLLLGKGINGLLTVMLVFSAVNAIFYFLVLRREGFFRKGDRRRLQPDVKKRIKRYNASVSAIIVCDKIVWDKSENFFLGRFCQATEIAYYNLGFNIAQRFVSVLPMTFWRVLFPAMSHYFGSGDRYKMERIFFLSTRYLAFFAFPIAAAGVILAYPMLLYFYGYEFVGAQRALQIVFVASLFLSLSNPASAVLYGYEKQAFIYKYGAVLAVLNIILDILLIPRFGAVGAATCYGIIAVLGAVGGLIYTCRTMRLRYPIVSVFKILFSTIIMATVMQIVVFQLPNLVGYISCAPIGIFVYLVCALVLGTFEKEDYEVLESVKTVLPGKTKGAVDWAVGFVSQFKGDTAAEHSSPPSQ